MPRDYLPAPVLLMIMRPSLLLFLVIAGVTACRAQAPAPDAAPATPPAVRRHTLSVLEHGAKGDTRTDDTRAFQAALDACAAQGGGVVEVPAGSYRFEGTLRIPANVTLRGTFTSAPDGDLRRMLEGRLGSSLLVHAGRARPDSAPFIELTGANAVLEGFAIGYPEWDPAVIPPVPYPPTVAVEAHGKGPVDNIAILNCFFLNSWEAIRLVNAGRHLIRNVTGYPIRRGIYVDQIWDVGRIENVHFWPFGHRYTVDDPYAQWINREGVAIEVGFSDWQILTNCFSFGYGVGYKFSASPKPGDGFGRGACGKIIGGGVDSARLPFQFEAAYSHWLISNTEIVGRWGEGAPAAVDIGPGVHGRVAFSNCAFWGDITRVVTMRAPEGIVSLEGCQIERWDDAAGAIGIEAGRAILQGNSFDRDGRRHLVVGPKAGVVIATGNLAAPGFQVEATPGARVIASANQTDTLVWPENAKSRYRVTVGAAGDSRYLEGWHLQEKAGPKRWSGAESRFHLPVIPGRAYELDLRIGVPAAALSDEAGVWLGDRRLAAITSAGRQTLRVSLPAQTTDTATLRIVTKGWIPREIEAGNGDGRTLGLELFAVDATAEAAGDPAPPSGAGDRVFDACSGGFIEQDRMKPAVPGL
ncbi:hypothetical protein OPIT5_24535 [Opitutaceae bacterium TAV5]|nr:hypothetical protein OPIT5_24535 [Opitutaceae bacterium TAV5]